MSDDRKVWFITGTSRGFGRVWAEAALKRGDRVAATARDVEDLEALTARFPDTVLPLRLDVTDREAVFAAVAAAHASFGRLDVVVANAGYGLFGAVEEIGEADARRQVDTNLFGTLWLLQASLPTLRKQGRGHVLITSSFGGLVNFATAGLYGASKFALEGLGEAVSHETEHLGLRVTLIEPASYATDFFGSSAAQSASLPAYDQARDRTTKVFQAMSPGDPAHTAETILRLVDMPDPPLRLLLGEHALPFVRGRYESRMAEWERWSSLADAAQ